MYRLHDTNVPDSPFSLKSVSIKFHSPCALAPSKFDSPDELGRKRPVNGAVPSAIDTAASSSSVVSMKCSPSSPRPITRIAVPDSGPSSMSARSETFV